MVFSKVIDLARTCDRDGLQLRPAWFLVLSLDVQWPFRRLFMLVPMMACFFALDHVLVYNIKEHLSYPKYKPDHVGYLENSRAPRYWFWAQINEIGSLNFVINGIIYLQQWTNPSQKFRRRTTEWRRVWGRRTDWRAWTLRFLFVSHVSSAHILTKKRYWFHQSREIV